MSNIKITNNEHGITNSEHDMKEKPTLLQGIISPWQYQDAISNNEIEIIVSSLYTTIRINERYYYFRAEDGKFDGTSTKHYKANTAHCEECLGTGWYGDNGPGIRGNNESVRCDCGTAKKCTNGFHRYAEYAGIPWCDRCNLEADMGVCRLHPVPKYEYIRDEI